MTRKTFAIAAILPALATLIGYGVPSLAAAPRDTNFAHRPPACQVRTDAPPDPSQMPGPPELKPTTITTIGQSYYCILDNYYGGPNLDDRSLLMAAFAGLTQELQRRGLDQAQAMPPALTGKADDDL